MRTFVTSTVISILIVLALTAVSTQSAQAQSFVALHEFTGGQDGSVPVAGLAMDRAGNLYGTTEGGGGGQGTVFKMTHKAGGWLFSPLYGFTGGNDGGNPEAAVTIGPNGSIYGTTSNGGTGLCGGHGCGTVFNLRPAQHASPKVFAPWSETVLYSFAGGSDGAFPSFGSLVFDQEGNIYGTTEGGGGSGCDGYGCGTVFRLAPSAGGQWTESVLYSFTGGSDGAFSVGSVIFDKAGNLYGTTASGGTYGCGTVFQLTPIGSDWTENTLYAFNPSVGDGCNSSAGLIFDAVGNLYGTSENGGVQGGGTAFELTPHSNGSWTETVLYAFTSGLGYGGPSGGLTMDAVGNLYGTTQGGGLGIGAVFKLTPSNGNWAYTSLHDFINLDDGEFPIGNVTLDASGNVYGTASQGGEYGSGVVWEITP
jgi:uncharacterized repeat protein (TIGR03803 family)